MAGNLVRFSEKGTLSRIVDACAVVLLVSVVWEGILFRQCG